MKACADIVRCFYAVLYIEAHGAVRLLLQC